MPALRGGGVSGGRRRRQTWVHLRYERMAEPSPYARNRRPWDV